MRGLKIENGIVIDVAKFDMIPIGWVESPVGVEIGWVDNGDGTFSAPPDPELTDDDKIARERIWRDSELCRSDIEINKAEDAAGVFDATNWRVYRGALRDWPADLNFPDSGYRPVAPDA